MSDRTPRHPIDLMVLMTLTFIFMPLMFSQHKGKTQE